MIVCLLTDEGHPKKGNVDQLLWSRFTLRINLFTTFQTTMSIQQIKSDGTPGRIGREKCL